MIGSFFVFVTLFMFYKKKWGSNAAYMALVYLLIRNTIRVLDLDNTKPFINDEEWQSLLIL